MEIEILLFFHKQASERRRRSRIKYLIKVNETRVTNMEEIEELIKVYFQNLFQAQPESARYEEVLQ
jgi:uncharacterized protein YlaN (UPF0358 family)